MAERPPADGTTNGGGGVHTRGHATGAESRPVRRTVPDEDGFTEPPSDTRRHRRVGSTGAGSHATAQARDAASPGLAPSTTDDLKRRIQARIDKHQARLRAQKNAIIAAGAVSDPVASPGRTESFGSPQRSARKSVAGQNSGRRVEDSLLAAGRQHETDRERRRQDQLMKEGRELTFTPELNPNSRSLVERSAAHDDPIEVRMVRHVRNMAAKRASAIAAQQLEEANSMPTFKPEINRNVAVRQTGDVATRSKQWAENRQRKAEQLKSQLQQREQSELKYRPQLNPHSVKIANQDSRRRQGDVADHLYAQAERQRIERLERQEQKLADEVLGYPAITRQAAVLVRDQDIADRLYNHAVELKQRREAAIADADKELKRKMARTGTSKSARLAGVAASGHLYRLAEEQRQKREALLAKTDEDNRRRSVPKLNPRSVAIASALGQTSEERLLQGVKSVQSEVRQRAKARAAAMAAASQQADAAASPNRPKQKKVEPVVKAMAAERLYQQSEERRERNAAREEEAKRKKMKECTFKPQIATHSRQIAQKTQHRGLSMYDRGKLWADKTEHKLRAQREKISAHETDGCTFQPKISRGPVSRPARIDHGQLDVSHNGRVRVRAKPVAPSAHHGDLNSSFGDGGASSLDRAHPGVDDFLKRQAKARAEKELRKTVPCADGSKWTGKTTKPVGPKFNHRRATRDRRPRRGVGGSYVAQHARNGTADAGPSESGGGRRGSVGSTRSRPRSHPIGASLRDMYKEAVDAAVMQATVSEQRSSHHAQPPAGAPLPNPGSPESPGGDTPVPAYARGSHGAFSYATGTAGGGVREPCMPESGAAAGGYATLPQFQASSSGGLAARYPDVDFEADDDDDALLGASLESFTTMERRVVAQAEAEARGAAEEYRDVWGGEVALAVGADGSMVSGGDTYNSRPLLNPTVDGYQAPPADGYGRFGDGYAEPPRAPTRQPSAPRDRPEVSLGAAPPAVPSRFDAPSAASSRAGSVRTQRSSQAGGDRKGKTRGVGPTKSARRSMEAHIQRMKAANHKKSARRL